MALLKFSTFYGVKKHFVNWFLGTRTFCQSEEQKLINEETSSSDGYESSSEEEEIENNSRGHSNAGKDSKGISEVGQSIC